MIINLRGIVFSLNVNVDISRPPVGHDRHPVHPAHCHLVEPGGPGVPVLGVRDAVDQVLGLIAAGADGAATENSLS